MTGEPLDLLRNVVRRLTNPKIWGEKFSEQYIEKRILDIVAQARSDRESVIDTCLQELDERYSHITEERTVYLSLEGIDCTAGSVRLGNVEFLKMTDAAIGGMIGRFREGLNRNPQWKDRHVQKVEEDLRRHFEGKTCAIYRVVAESGRAKERAELEVRRVLELLRYAAPAIYPNSREVRIGLEGEATRARQYIFSESTSGFTGGSKRVGGIQIFYLSDDSLRHLEEMGVLHLAELLKEPHQQLSDFERTLFRAIHWFSSAQTQAETENKCLNLITCIEVCLTPEKGDPIGTAIAEGVALLLHDDLGGRKALKRRIKELFGQRSAVSHGGDKQVLEGDVRELERYVHKLLRVLIGKRVDFKSQQDLLDYIEDRKLS